MGKVFSPSLETIQKSLKEVFPELEQTAYLHLLGEGFGSIVVETPAGIVFRIAKNHIVYERHKREHVLLGILNNRFTDFSIPQPLFYADASKWFPFGLIGYRKIEGRALKPQHLDENNLETIASSIAKFITQLQMVKGIVDFECVAIGDPMADFVTQKYLGTRFLDKAISSYRRLNSTVKLPKLENHLGRLMGLRELMGLEYGIDIDFIDKDTYTKISSSILKDL